MLLAVSSRVPFLVATPHPAAAQKMRQNGVAIWELPRAKMNAMLTAIPKTDAERYERLRQDFAGFGCTGSRIEEQALDKKGRHRNLVCTLPGEVPQAIIISGWYSKRRIYNGDSAGWPDAAMLPMLYNALSAEPHHFTLLFAELDGDNGEWHFFHDLKKSGPSPVVLVDLSALGFGVPHFTVVAPQFLPAGVRPVAQVVLNTAWTVAEFQGLDADPSYEGLNTLFGIQPAPVSGEPGDCPRISVFSTFGSDVTLEHFRQDHDFLAFLLGGIDSRLVAQSAAPGPAPR